jgi:hypothetical protein
MRPKARGLAQHGGPIGWLEENDPTGCDFVFNGRTTPLAPVLGCSAASVCHCTNKKENQIFLIYREIQNGADAKSYMTNGLLIYRDIFAHFLIY